MLKILKICRLLTLIKKFLPWKNRADISEILYFVEGNLFWRLSSCVFHLVVLGKGVLFFTFFKNISCDKKKKVLHYTNGVQWAKCNIDNFCETIQDFFADMKYFWTYAFISKLYYNSTYYYRYQLQYILKQNTVPTQHNFTDKYSNTIQSQ